MKNIFFIIAIIASATIYSQEKAELVWHTDLSKAVPVAIEQNKPLLLFFTGSDWCGWCIRLKREVFAFEKFKTWTDANVVLVELDFPRRKQLPANIQKQNRELAGIFAVRGYPTVWLVTPQVLEDNKINFLKHGSLGYVAGGPDKWITTAEKFLTNK